MAIRLGGKLVDVLKQVIERLIDQRPGAKQANCYLTLDLDAIPPPSPGQFIYAVKPGQGSFDDANWDGGGQGMATTASELTVRVYSPQFLDQHGRDNALLTHDTVGVLKEWEGVIKCLTDPDWSPMVVVDEVEIEILRDPLIPTGWLFGESALQNGATVGWAQQSFRLSFDMDFA